MISLSKDYLIKTEYLSSKGNQLKWNKDNIWHKADNNGYEGLSEYVISKLLKFSNLKQEEYVDYEIEQISYEGKHILGCRSKNFLKDGQKLITLQRLYYATQEKDLNDVIDEIDDTKEKIIYLVNTVESLTGIENFGEYLLRLLIIDTLFLNEDRHFHNIAFIEENDKFLLCPIFDNGAGLLSDTRLDYPLENDEISMIKNVKSKTIIEDFDEQLNVMKQLHKVNIEFSFSDKDIIDILNEVKEYDEKICKRVCKILIHQRQRYLEYFNL